MEEEKNKTGKDPGKASQPKQGSVLKELLSGSMVSDKILLKNFWYILMLTILGAIYIANRFNAEKITRESNKLSREVRDLRAEALSTSADLMEASRQSEGDSSGNGSGAGTPRNLFRVLVGPPF